MTKPLHELARRHGIHVAYRDVLGKRVKASERALHAVLRALGVEVSSTREIRQRLRLDRAARWCRALEPVHVAWEGRLDSLRLRMPERALTRPLRCRVISEDGEKLERSVRMNRSKTNGRSRVEGQIYDERELPLRLKLPVGYHRLEVETAAGQFNTLVLAAPQTTYSSPQQSRQWGLFAPLYSMPTDQSWGGGDFTALRRLMEWEATQGGTLVGTLPLLPAFLGELFEPSPYSPVSRLLWNEFYIDVCRIPELSECPGARRLLASRAFQKKVRALRSDRLVQYRPEMALKRAVLERLARSFFSTESARRRELDRFIAKHPQVADYAAFRATMERQRVPWTQWPERLRAGNLGASDYAAGDLQYYLYAQWIADEQMEELTATSKRVGVRLYLDLPLGVNSAGYDTWREQDLFALEASGGAPPDPVFTKGQDWGFAPIRPQAAREQGYRYVIAYLRHHLRHAGMLRVDHVMGLHRLYWVPKGLLASDGAYVSYPFDELYALLSIESHRHQSIIVGENLGTVPPAVNSNLKRRQVREMFVVQYELRPDNQRPIRSVPRHSVASLNTHDMPPFAAFWNDADIADRFDLGLMRPSEMRLEKMHRRQMRAALIALLRRRGLIRGDRSDVEAVWRAMLGYLAASDAEFLLVNLEDLWQETASQNVPGTTGERVNWRRKLKYPLAELDQVPGLLDCLKRVNELRVGVFTVAATSRSRPAGLQTRSG